MFQFACLFTGERGLPYMGRHTGSPLGRGPQTMGNFIGPYNDPLHTVYSRSPYRGRGHNKVLQISLIYFISNETACNIRVGEIL